MTPWKPTASDRNDPNSPGPARSNASDPAERRREVCASACEGIPTEELEKGILLELVAACIRIRDDERLAAILDRLAPPRITLRPVPDPEQAEEPEAALPDIDAEAEPPAAAVADDVRIPATEKFRLGMRVRLTAEGFARIPGITASPRGVVTGFSRSDYEVRVSREGRATPERFPAEFWEPDPDQSDVNASLVSGVYSPVGAEQPASRIARRLPAPGWRRPLPPAD